MSQARFNKGHGGKKCNMEQCPFKTLGGGLSCPKTSKIRFTIFLGGPTRTSVKVLTNQVTCGPKGLVRKRLPGRTSWRTRQCLGKAPLGAGGRSAGRSSVTELKQHKGRIFNSKRRKVLQDLIGAERLSALLGDAPSWSSWQRDLCQDGDIEPNPGPSGHMRKGT